MERQSDTTQRLWRLGRNTPVSSCMLQSTHIHTVLPTHGSVRHELPWPVSAGQSCRSAQDDSWTSVPVTAPQCRNTHMYANTHIRNSDGATATLTSNPAGPLDLSLCPPVRPHDMIRRPCDMTVTTYWCSGESTHNAVHFTLHHNPPFSLCLFFKV